MDSLTLPRPDDFHLHVRDGAMLEAVLPATSRVFGRALLMPNTRPPIVTTTDVEAYRERVVRAIPEGHVFTALFALYLTRTTDPSDLRAALGAGLAHAVKYYPAGATTHSEFGLSSLDEADGVLEVLAETGTPLCVHGEVTDPDTDIFDREAIFLDTVAGPVLERHPALRMVIEHATTMQAVQFVRGFSDGRVAATITPQHLLLDRNDLLSGGLRPHFYCLPVLKRATHKQALLEAATSGDPRFFLGTDSAPHTRESKQSACGCAGCYSAPFALSLYATAFESQGALDRLPNFAAGFGADFYRLPRATQTVRLVRRRHTIPEVLTYPSTQIVPLYAGQTLEWDVEIA